MSFRVRMPARAPRRSVRSICLSAAAPGLLAGVLIAPSAAAETPPPTVTVERVVVTGQRAGALSVPNADEARREIERTPGGVDLVPAEAFRLTRATTLKDALDFTPGVYAQPKFGEDSRLSIRGSGLSRNFHLRGVRLLVDGMMINAADGAGDFQEIDLMTADYIEVFKGANALQFGAASLGGAINLVSPTGYSAPALRLRAEGGSFGFGRASAEAAFRDGAFDGYAGVSLLTANGFRQNSDQDSARFAANLGWRIAPAAETRLYFWIADIEQKLPGSLSRGAALNDPRTTSPFLIAQNYARDIDSVRVASRTVVDLDAAARLAFGAGYVDKRLYHPIFQVIDNAYADWNVFARLDGAVDVAGQAVDYAFGVTWSGGRNDAQRFVNLAGQRGALTSSQDETSENLELFAELRTELVPGLQAIAGLQALSASRDLDDRFLANGDQSGSRDFDALSPRFGLLWQASARVQLFANLSRSVEPPPLSELAGSPTIFTTLELQKAWTGEIGARGTLDLAGGTLGFDVALYRAVIDGELQFFQTAPFVFQVVNADTTIHQGLELGFDWRIADVIAGGDGFSLSGAWTWSDFVFDGDPAFGDNRLPVMPEHYVRLKAGYDTGFGLSFGIDAEFVPIAPYIDNTNSVKSEPYALLGLRAAYARDGWTLFVEGRNVTDARYISNVSAIAVPTVTNQNVYNPGDGAAVYVGLELAL